MSLTQGAALPDVTTTQTQTSNAPSWYTDYLQGIAQSGASAANNAKFIGIQPMQQQSYDMASANVGNYQPSLNQAKDITTGTLGMSAVDTANPLVNKASANAYENVGNYMSPYINDVVNQIGTLGTRQIAQTLAPQATSGLVGSGQFGSKRGAEALGQTIRDANQNILGTQTQALNTGYQNAMTQAQADLQRQGQLGLGMGNLETADINSRLGAGSLFDTLAKTTSNLGLQDVNTLNTLGTQQQTIKQNEQLFPLQMAAQEAALLRGYQIPTSTTSTFTGPMPGAYQPSDLSSIIGGGTLLAALGKSGTDSALTGVGKAITGTGSWLKDLFSNTPNWSDAGYNPNFAKTITTNGTNALSPYDANMGVNFSAPDAYK